MGSVMDQSTWEKPLRLPERTVHSTGDEVVVTLMAEWVAFLEHILCPRQYASSSAFVNAFNLYELGIISLSFG